MGCIVDELVLMADSCLTGLVDEVLHAAVAARRDLPLEAQFKVSEEPVGNEVATASFCDMG